LSPFFSSAKPGLHLTLQGGCEMKVGNPDILTRYACIHTYNVKFRLVP
jgi:hypothetical protein